MSFFYLFPKTMCHSFITLSNFNRFTMGHKYNCDHFDHTCVAKMATNRKICTILILIKAMFRPKSDIN